MYKYLNFFNKKGEYCNFSYDPNLDKWTGRIDFNTVSEGLIEDYQLYVLEQFIDSSSGLTVLGRPHLDSSYLPGPSAPVGPSGTTASAIGVTASFDAMIPVEDIFIYNFELGATQNLLNKYYGISYDFDYDPVQTIAGPSSTYPGIKETSNIRSEALQINIGFQPSNEDGYTSHLYLKDSSGHIFADITVYGEGEEEDERLKDMLMNLGIDLLPQDSIIFDTVDVNESETDWVLINQKRKELLLEYSNIFPYLGSYKALINVIKYFGYQNVRMKEYWKNIDTTSKNFGKYITTDISDLFTENANFNNSRLVPSRIYKKTSLFGLYYDITVDSGEFDDDGIPIVEEVFPFTPQEILIKIFALKKKLKEYFLPLNARIIDVVGEAVFYGKYDINIWNEQARIDSISIGIKPKFSVYPSNKGTIEDLRPLSFFGCPVGPDLNLGGSSNILSWRVGYGSTIYTGGISDTVQTFYIRFEVPGPTAYTVSSTFVYNANTGQTAFSPAEIANSLIDSIKNYGDPISNNFTAYQEGGSSGIIRIVQKVPIGNGTLYVGATSNTTGGIPGGIFLPGPTASTSPPLGNSGGTSTSINVSSGPFGTFGPSGAPMSYYESCFLGYFDRTNLTINELNDAEGIPVGCPMILQNETFNITWDDADVTFDQIDQPDPSTYGSTGSYLFSRFTVSNDIIGWTSIYPNPGLPTGATYLNIPVGASISGFPYSSYPHLNVYSWNNLGYYGHHEMQWIVSKPETDTPEFVLNSGRLSISEINQYPIILPYAGNYKVELYLWDGYNNKSSLINSDYIEVTVPDIDLIGWYQYRERDYSWDTHRYRVQSEYAKWPKNSGYLPNENLTWNDYGSTWDIPMHPNEEMDMADMSFNSLDALEFYQSQTNPSDNPLVDRLPYKFNLIGEAPRWNDLYHLWWDGMGTRLTQFNIQGLTGQSATIFMTRENTQLDINAGSIYRVGSIAGYTGATGATSLIGATGDLIVSELNKRVYRFDGTSWNYVKDIVDCFHYDFESSNLESKFKSLVKALNETIQGNSEFYPYLSDFIYYYNEQYDSNSNLSPYINAVSKNFDRSKRHIMNMIGGTVDETTYETTNFGFIGDIPTYFEMYDIKNLAFGSLDGEFVIDSGFPNTIPVNNEVNGILPLSDGSMIVYGDFTSYKGVSCQRIIKLTKNGALDPSFNSGGAGPNGRVMAAVVQSDGKIVIGGLFTAYNGTSRIRLARLEEDGTLDASYTVGTGIVRAAGIPYVYDMFIQDDDKVIIGGIFTSYNGSLRNNLIRVDSSGILDTSFNTGIGPNNSVFNILKTREDKFIIFGLFNSYDGSTVPRGITRINSDGTLDSSFYSGVGFNSINGAFGADLDEFGRILLSGNGWTTYGGTSVGKAVRLTENGNLDPSFTFGTIPTAAGPYRLKSLSNGKTLFAGPFTSYNGNPCGGLIVVNSNGSFDSSFNAGQNEFSSTGVAWGSGTIGVAKVRIQNDGKILIPYPGSTYNGVLSSGLVRIIPENSGSSILISGMTAPYYIGSTGLINLASELNGSTAQSFPGIRNYEYNLVYGSSGWTGSGSPTLVPKKIQAISKAFTSPEEIEIEYEGIIGTSYGRSLIKNPNWNGIRVLKYTRELPLLTNVNFTYDLAKMKGKTNPTWILHKENDSDFQDIYFNNPYFSYLFTKRGSYTFSLTLEDTNGNEKTITKTELIKIV
jgi:uncharacterized delta-60 repeat protein